MFLNTAARAQRRSACDHVDCILETNWKLSKQNISPTDDILSSRLAHTYTASSKRDGWKAADWENLCWTRAEYETNYWWIFILFFLFFSFFLSSVMFLCFNNSSHSHFNAWESPSEWDESLHRRVVDMGKLQPSQWWPLPVHAETSDALRCRLDVRCLFPWALCTYCRWSPWRREGDRAGSCWFHRRFCCRKKK